MDKIFFKVNVKSTPAKERALLRKLIPAKSLIELNSRKLIPAKFSVKPNSQKLIPAKWPKKNSRKLIPAKISFLIVIHFKLNFNNLYKSLVKFIHTLYSCCQYIDMIIQHPVI